ncbi:uncharacterized protein [Rutidosis leptorrhynchoides]|uniref:uncharacterized protein n=1 Tax=Rutidosis leptorrhynchoides TaxID=125765 RepID=UPI003A9A3204
MVRGWLINSIDKEIKLSVKYAVTARDIWTDLQERFDKENAPRAYELRRAITMIHQEHQIVSSYYTKLRSIWDEIASVNPMPSCSCNKCTCELSTVIGKVRDKERLYDFLMGLNDDYHRIRLQILSSDPLPSVMAAFHYSQNNTRRFSNYKKEECDKEEKICTKCQKIGHTIDGCFEIIGYPEWWAKKYTNSKMQTGRYRSSKAANVVEQKQTTTITKEDYDKLMQML